LFAPRCLFLSLPLSISFFCRCFNSNTVKSPFSLIELHCSSCNSGTNGGNIAAQREITWDGKTKTFSFTLSPEGGWEFNPYDARKAWIQPTQCEFVELLKGLDSILVFGDFLK